MMMNTDYRDFFVLEVGSDRLDYASLFGNEHPTFIEIGSGKGEFISQYPLLHPDFNFIGFELKQKRIEIILRKLKINQHHNVRLARKFIDHSITDFLPPESIKGVFIQHPDPWPKRRHHKRRLINQDFLKALSDILMHDGFVQISTDHDEYAAWIVDEFLASPYFSSVYEDIVLHKPGLDNHVVTWFEQEQRRLGFEPKFMLFRKI